VAHVVVVLVLAQVGEVEPGAAEQRAVVALQQPSRRRITVHSRRAQDARQSWARSSAWRDMVCRAWAPSERFCDNDLVGARSSASAS
jgi:hypothetical protein